MVLWPIDVGGSEPPLGLQAASEEVQMIRILVRARAGNYNSIKHILSTAGLALSGASSLRWICLLRFFISCTWMVNYVGAAQRLRTHREIPCGANLVFLEHRCPEEYFEGDQLSVKLFTSFYEPDFRTAPV